MQLHAIPLGMNPEVQGHLLVHPSLHTTNILGSSQKRVLPSPNVGRTWGKKKQQKNQQAKPATTKPPKPPRLYSYLEIPLVFIQLLHSTRSLGQASRGSDELPNACSHLLGKRFLAGIFEATNDPINALPGPSSTHQPGSYAIGESDPEVLLRVPRHQRHLTRSNLRTAPRALPVLSPSRHRRHLWPMGRFGDEALNNKSSGRFYASAQVKQQQRKPSQIQAAFACSSISSSGLTHPCLQVRGFFFF